MAFVFQQRYESEVEDRMARFAKRCRKRIDGVLPRWKRHGWDTVGSSTSRMSWGARRGPSSAGRRNSTSCPTTRPRGGCGVPVPVEKKDRRGATTRAEPESGPERPHRRGSGQGKRALDRSLAAANRRESGRAGNAGQRPGRARLDGRAKAGAAQDSQGLGRRSEHPDRDAQFQRIAALKAEYFALGNPVLSLDTKAKEHLGQLFRQGRVWTQRAFQALDHDFPSWASGVIIPHGIYDLARNRGHINIGLSHDTSQFACDSLRWYWNRIGQQCYPGATCMLLLCDCGGSNAASQYLFKHDLQALVNDLGIEIRVAHYPSYCSKYNPIERRFFPHVARACQGMLFDTLETVVGLMRKTSTRTGLRATVNVIRRLYQTGRKVANDFKATMKILFDDLLPKWNYVAKPRKPDSY